MSQIWAKLCFFLTSKFVRWFLKQAAKQAFFSALVVALHATMPTMAVTAAVRDQLRGVQKIQASHYAFAAILADGSIVLPKLIQVSFLRGC